MNSIAIVLRHLVPALQAIQRDIQKQSEMLPPESHYQRKRPQKSLALPPRNSSARRSCRIPGHRQEFDLPDDIEERDSVLQDREQDSLSGGTTADLAFRL